MKYSPYSNILYTDKGRVIKKLSCPKDMAWQDMAALDYRSRQCTHCQHSVVDSRHYGEFELTQMVNDNPNACLKLEYNQTNISIMDLYESMIAENKL